MALNSNIAYDPEKLNEMSMDAKNFYESINQEYEALLTSIDNIRDSWEGQESEEATGELDSVKNNVEELKKNAKDTKDLLEQVANNFNNIRYNG